ncbi:MAG: hypothetical protein LBN27_12110 [Prevotellaceae bacterium]|jgi:hypothetical protein|nr:hypothetical protein [Prevotellaceae bacterium]
MTTIKDLEIGAEFRTVKGKETYQYVGTSLVDGKTVYLTRRLKSKTSGFWATNWDMEVVTE